MLLATLTRVGGEGALLGIFVPPFIRDTVGDLFPLAFLLLVALAEMPAAHKAFGKVLLLFVNAAEEPFEFSLLRGTGSIIGCLVVSEFQLVGSEAHQGVLHRICFIIDFKCVFMVFRLPSQRSQIGVVIGVGNGGHHGAVGAEKIGCAAAFRLDHFFPLAILFLIALGHCPLAGKVCGDGVAYGFPFILFVAT